MNDIINKNGYYDFVKSMRCSTGYSDKARIPRVYSTKPIKSKKQKKPKQEKNYFALQKKLFLLRQINYENWIK